MPPFVTMRILDEPDESRDVHREVHDALIGRFGYTHRDTGRFTIDVDSQHQALVVVGPNFGQRRTNQAEIGLGVIRRDVRDLESELLHDRLPEWRATIRNATKPHFWGEPDPYFSYLRHTSEDVQEWLDGNIPRLVTEACNYGFVAMKLEEAASHGSSYAASSDRTWSSRLATALLDGWTDEAEDEFMSVLVSELEAEDRHDVDRSKRQGRIDRVRAWIAEHPDGIERECFD